MTSSIQKFQIKRIYEPYNPKDGQRILVDRLWPRGKSKEAAKIVFWSKEIAPSNALRKWYDHEHAKWPEFRKRYFAELNASPEAVEEFLARLDSGTVTFLFSSREEKLNNAAALKEYVERKLQNT